MWCGRRWMAAPTGACAQAVSPALPRPPSSASACAQKAPAARSPASERGLKAAIVGISGPVLSDREAEILHAHRPAGVILFGRNVQHPAQLARLTAALREVLPPRAVLMVDQ